MDKIMRKVGFKAIVVIVALHMILGFGSSRVFSQQTGTITDTDTVTETDGETVTDIITDTDTITDIDPGKTEVLPDIRKNPDGTLDIEPIELIEEIFEHNQGVFLGDLHGNLNIPEFLAKYMEDLSDAGVTILFMEMFDQDDPKAEAAIDIVTESGEITPVVEYLKKTGWDKEKGWAEAIALMVKAALDAGIDVIGIDIRWTEDRTQDQQNRAWASEVKEYIDNSSFDDDSRYIVFGGGGHSADYPFNKGVDIILGIPSVDFDDEKSDGDTPIVTTGDGKDSDFEIYLPKSKNQPPPLY